jgi:hypothetical protein
LQNFQVVPHGGVRKRPGTKFVVEQRSRTKAVAFIPFQYSTTQAYMLVFGDGYVWFMKDQGIITNSTKTITFISQASPGIVTSAAHGFSNGDWIVLTSAGGMVQLNNRLFEVANVTTNTFTLKDNTGAAVNTASYTAYTSGGTASRIVTLTTPYVEAEVGELQFAQSADTLFITHQNHPLRKLTRSSHTSWTLETVDIRTGPFRPINPTTTHTITPSGFSAGATGYGTYQAGVTCTLTSSVAMFNASHVGALFRLNEEGGATGVMSAPVGDSAISLANNQTYTAEGHVYGVTNVSTLTTWQYVTRVPYHKSGRVRVNGAGGGYFDSDYLHPTYCVVEITGYTSSTVVTAQILRYQMPASIASSGTSFWEEGAWSDYRGYPNATAFYEQRLMLAGSPSDPTVIWGSVSGAYEDFTDGSDDDDALVYRAAAGSADVMRWMMGGRLLTVGSSQGEFAVAASNRNEALTPSNVKCTLQTTFGTSKVPPLRIGQTVIYPQRSGATGNDALKIREFAYSFDKDAFDSTDITVFSPHITGSGVVRLAYQTEPDSLIWALRSDGKLACCTYERTQEVVAWHRHVIGGTNTAVKMIGVIPGSDGDELWLSVERTIDGATHRYIEVLNPVFNEDLDVKEDAKLLDSSLTYEGGSTTMLTGLWHLRGQAVKVLNNGAVETATVDSVGQVTLARATTKATVGLAYTAILETEDIEAGAQAGVAQSRVKRISQAYLRLRESLGGSLGPDENHVSAILYRTPATPMGASPPLYTGLKAVDFPSGYDREARVYITHDDPLPFFVTCIVVEQSTAG